MDHIETSIPDHETLPRGHEASYIMTPPGSPLPASVAPTPAESQTSVEDYDDLTEPATVGRRQKQVIDAATSTLEAIKQSARSGVGRASSYDALTGKENKVSHPFRADDAELRAILQRGLLRAKDSSGKTKARAKFSDLVFTRKFSAFDGRNADAANSPFHGFFTLFWMAMFIYMLKIGAENWKTWGNPLGTNEILQTMFRKDVLVLLIADGVMCGLTGVSWILQRLIYSGYINWDRSGWVLQNVSSSIRMLFDQHELKLFP
jgi:sterol O-acyltransferase